MVYSNHGNGVTFSQVLQLLLFFKFWVPIGANFTSLSTIFLLHKKEIQIMFYFSGINPLYTYLVFS